MQSPEDLRFDTDTSSHYVSRLNASSSVNKRVGPTIILALEKIQEQKNNFPFHITAIIEIIRFLVTYRSLLLISQSENFLQKAF
jgi:hypothetical protein